MYDSTPTLVLAARVPAGGMCGPLPCWKPISRGFRYANRSGVPDGVRTLDLGDGTGAAIAAKADGIDVDMPPLPLYVPVRVQLQNTAGTCFEATFGAPKRNDERRFAGRSD